MKVSKRLALLLTLLAGAAGLVLFGGAPPDKGDVVQATARTAAARASVSARPTATDDDPASTMILAIRPRGASSASADAFAPRNWNPPPPPPPPASTAPPPKPSAPPLPFTLLGKKLEDGAWQVFLGLQDRTYVVKSQDVIDNTYRVESIAPPSLVMTYLPLNERQTLAIGGNE